MFKTINNAKNAANGIITIVNGINKGVKYIAAIADIMQYAVGRLNNIDNEKPEDNASPEPDNVA